MTISESEFGIGIAMDVPALRERLAKHEQSHVLDFWEDLSDDQKRALYDDVSGLDLAELTEDFDKGPSTYDVHSH